MRVFCLFLFVITFSCAKERGNEFFFKPSNDLQKMNLCGKVKKIVQSQVIGKKDGNLEIKRILSCNFNKTGNLKTKIRFEQRMPSLNYYYFYENSKLVKKVTLALEQSPINELYSYNESMLLIEQKFQSTSDSSTIRYNYDDKGNVISMLSLFQTDTFSTSYINEYFDQKLIKTTQISTDTNTTEYCYHGDKLIHIKDNQSQINYKYTSGLISSELRFEYNKLVKIIKYNKYLDEVEIFENNKTKRYRYKYDNYNNWVKRTSNINPNEYMIREISYYQ
jgi:hypothetical protein